MFLGGNELYAKVFQKYIAETVETRAEGYPIIVDNVEDKELLEYCDDEINIVDNTSLRDYEKETLEVMIEELKEKKYLFIQLLIF